VAGTRATPSASTPASRANSDRRSSASVNQSSLPISQTRARRRQATSAASRAERSCGAMLAQLK
jgi:hypothetical protein